MKIPGLENELFKYNTKLKLNQEQRALAVLKALEVQGSSVLILMDGHGRFLFTIMKLMTAQGKNVDDYTFIVVDINSTCHSWHQRFFPKSVYSIKADIFDFESTISGNCLTYYNFCGMGTDPNMHENLRSSISWKVLNNKPFIISCSFRNVSLERELSEVSETRRLIEDLMPVYPENKIRDLKNYPIDKTFDNFWYGRRRNFVTYAFGINLIKARI